VGLRRRKAKTGDAPKPIAKREPNAIGVL